MELSELIDRYRGPLVGLFISWGAPHSEAIELAQDSFADAYLSREKCRGDWSDTEVFGRWLRGFARNNFRNWRRSLSRRSKRLQLVEPQTLDSAVNNDSTGSVTDEDSRLAGLRFAIQNLPRKQREAIIMHYLEETSVREVAALLCVTEKTVEGRLYQGRLALRRRLTSQTSSFIGKAVML